MNEMNIWNNFVQSQWGFTSEESQWCHCRIWLIVGIVALCFVIGLTVPFIVHNYDDLDEVSEFSHPHKHFGIFNKGHFSDHHPVLDHLFITVKTSKKFQNTRLEILSDTWISLVRNQV